MNSRTNLFIIIPLLLASAGLAETAKPRPWESVKDDVYLQEAGKKLVSGKPIVAVALLDKQVFCAFNDGLCSLNNDTFVPCSHMQSPIRRMKSLQNALWVITGAALYRFNGGAWHKLADGDFHDVCEHLGQIIVSSSNNLLRVAGDTLEPIPASGLPTPPHRIASYSETLYILFPGRLALFTGSTLDPINVIDWGQLPSQDTRDMLVQGSRLYVATDRGLGLLRGMAMTSIRGPQGLCYEDTTCLAKGFDHDLWIGTTEGAIRCTNNEYQYFAAGRWLPNNRVNDIACGDHVVYIATDGGLGIIEYEPFTLLKKAAYYERHLEEWGQKRLGFTHKLEWDEPTGEWVREISDNDAGWSTHYLCAQCFKYAVTHDAQAREEAINFFNTLKWCEEITNMPGFPARSIWAAGEKSHKAQHGSGGLPAEWHATSDGLWEWKGDTSSDETDAHFYAASIFHDLTATGRDKERAKEHVDRIATRIIEDGWTLRDVDGQPTRWARWDPEYFHGYEGQYARGLNGLGILSYMRTAYALTGNPKYEEATQQLLGMDYLDPVLRQKLVFPPDFIFHSDDRLACYSYFPLLRYETGPALRSMYLRSLERSWEVERIEHNPWFNFIYGALTGNDCEAQQAAAHLREWPLDCIDYRFQNSRRHDLQTPSGYVAYSGGVKGLSPRERGPMRWSDCTLDLDGGSNLAVVDPSAWLEAYWMGRYFGFIQAPATDDPKLTTVEKRHLQLGAKPYDGPPRP